MKRYLTPAVLVLAIVANSALAQKPQIQWDNDFDFTQVSTFQWFDTAESSMEANDPFMHSLVVNTIKAELAQSGLTEVDANPDVLVTYHTSTQDRVRLQSSHYGYGFGGYGYDWDYWGYGWGGPTSTTTRVIEYEEGTLVIDVWDPVSDTLIWRGAITRVFSQNVRTAERQIERGIERMFREGEKLWRRANR